MQISSTSQPCPRPPSVGDHSQTPPHLLLGAEGGVGTGPPAHTAASAGPFEAKQGVPLATEAPREQPVPLATPSALAAAPMLPGAPAAGWSLPPGASVSPVVPVHSCIAPDEPPSLLSVPSPPPPSPPWASHRHRSSGPLPAITLPSAPP